MTTQELCNMDIAKLKAMSEAEVEAHFAPMFPITRPTKSLAEVDSRKRSTDDFKSRPKDAKNFLKSAVSGRKLTPEQAKRLADLQAKLDGMEA